MVAKRAITFSTHLRRELKGKVKHCGAQIQ